MFDAEKLQNVRALALVVAIACDEMLTDPPPDDDVARRLASVARVAGEACAEARTVRAAHRASQIQSAA